MLICNRKFRETAIKMKIILASASPRRQELLARMGCSFQVMVSDVIENNRQNLSPSVLAVNLAQAKAAAVAKLMPAAVVIGADTVVTLAGRIFGKPADEMQAAAMLRLLAGKKHEVISGVAVVAGEFVWTDYALTIVQMRELTDKEIASYVAAGESLDKAGAYGIQGKGALLIDSIAGCYYNVVGLPLVTLAKLLQKAGVSLL